MSVMSEQRKAYLAQRASERRKQNPSGRSLTATDFDVAWDCLVIDQDRKIGLHDEGRINFWLNEHTELDITCLFGYPKYLKQDFIVAMLRRLPHRFIRINSGPGTRFVPIFVRASLLEVLGLFYLDKRIGKGGDPTYYNTISARLVRSWWNRCGEKEQEGFFRDNPWARVQVESGL